MRPSYLYNGNHYTGKTTSLYQDSPLGRGFLSQFSRSVIFPIFQHCPNRLGCWISLSYQQIRCGDTYQIWKWFKESHRYFSKIKYFLNERQFNKPHPWLFVFFYFFYELFISSQEKLALIDYRFIKKNANRHGIYLIWTLFPSQRPMTRSFDAFFDLRLTKRLSKQSWGWRFETPSQPLWRHSNDLGFLCLPLVVIDLR